jgi:hypothetical protein
MEDVSRRIVNEMAACIKANVEAGEPRPGGGDASVGDGASSGAPPMVTARPINAVPLFFQVLWSGIRRLFGAKT